MTWKFISYTVIQLILVLYSPAATAVTADSELPVKVICETCTAYKDKLAVHLYGRLIIRYTMLGEFTNMIIKYNNTNEISMNTVVINGKDVKDKRIHFSDKPIKSGDTYSIIITLDYVTLADDGLKFTYLLTDLMIKTRSGSNTVKVIEEVPKTSDKRQTNDIHVYIIIGLSVLVAILISITIIQAFYIVRKRKKATQRNQPQYAAVDENIQSMTDTGTEMNMVPLAATESSDYEPLNRAYKPPHYSTLGRRNSNYENIIASVPASDYEILEA